MVDAPDAGVFDAAGARYGVDPALLAARARSVAAAQAQAASEATPATVFAPDDHDHDRRVPAAGVVAAGPLALRPDLVAASASTP